MNPKALSKTVEEKVLQGVSKKEIFGELGGTDDLARMLAATPIPEKRHKFKNLNYLLAAIIFYFALVKLSFSTFSLMSVDAPFFLYPLGLLVPAAAVYLGIGIIKFKGYLYLPVGILGFVPAFNSFGDIAANFNNSGFWLTWLVVHVPLFLGAVIAFYLKKQLCPHLGFMGAKSNSRGSYLFLEKAG